MKTIKPLVLLLLVFLGLQSCGSIDVINTWKAPQDNVDDFKQRNILVIARTNNTDARIAFETAFADEMRRRGMKATESFTKFPKIHAEYEMSEERLKMVRSIMNSEGYDGIVITAVKDKQTTVETTTNGVYAGTAFDYPGYYRGFYRYYRTPYAVGPYYENFGGYIPLSTTTRTRVDYVVETLAFNLTADENDQLVAAVTSKIIDPKNAEKTALEYVEQLAKHLEAKN
ncbi:hypothetical protein [Gilvibacter sediminis]|uniref:hypothetical protein n=1 Tax=Gilvibacter sediminis TaxID=379071 RepID=UPI0023505DC3|nr:hypothetical protein [Gilvibacter sediminis]MDC7998956.1 hypothetical protein [Gilvibacter sediminis]